MAIYMMRDGIAVTGISLNTSNTSTNSTTYQLTATITPSNATNKNVIWTSSSPSNVTVSSTGLVTRVGSPGTYTITATTEDGGYTASCSIAFYAGCFLKGTPILINGGYKNIENIVRGDIVMSFDEDKGEIVYNKVINFIKHPYEGIMIKLNGGLLEATYNHPVYTSKDKENREYKFIGDIEEGDWLYTKDGYVQVTEKEERDYNGDVYNFTVDNNHNYFVGDGILVHNAVTGGS